VSDSDSSESEAEWVRVEPQPLHSLAIYAEVSRWLGFVGVIAMKIKRASYPRTSFHALRGEGGTLMKDSELVEESKAYRQRGHAQAFDHTQLYA
jgi:hypothetical protein